jgi:biotin synthase
MGETEQEILEVAQRIRDMGGHNHMFAFFPEQGSMMEDWEPVPKDQWRRVQLARFLIDYRDIHIKDMQFNNEGQVVDFGMDQQALEETINSGVAFQTSGCPGKDDEVSACNRPYGDSSVSDIRSFPFALNDKDVVTVRRQMAGEDIDTLDVADLDS